MGWPMTTWNGSAGRRVVCRLLAGLGRICSLHERGSPPVGSRHPYSDRNIRLIRAVTDGEWNFRRGIVLPRRNEKTGRYLGLASVSFHSSHRCRPGVFNFPTGAAEWRHLAA